MLLSQIVLAASLLIYLLNCQVVDHWRPRAFLLASQLKTDPTIEDIVGAETVATISKASRIRIFRLKPFVTELTARQKRQKYFANYEVVARRKVDAKRMAQLKSTLLEPGTYMNPDDVNKCTFAATTGFEISYKRESLFVIISYPCKKVLFISRGHELYRDVKTLEVLDRVARGFFKDLPTAN